MSLATSGSVSTATRPTPIVGGSRKAARNPFFDNAKFLLIVFVVMGHNWYPAIGDSHVTKALYIFVYSFHIPAFVLLCGYFSRSFEGHAKQWRKLIVGVLLPYLIFQIAYTALTDAVNNKPILAHLNMAGPIYVCWFLLALFVWRASTPLLKSLPHPIIITTLVSLAAGVIVTSTDFAFSRTLQLLPWFTIGLCLKPSHFLVLRRTWVRLTAGGVLVVALACAYLISPIMNVRWLDREWDYKELNVSAPTDLVLGLLLDVVTAVMVVAVLAVIPSRKTWFTALGALTMYPFLLHGLVVREAQHLGVHSLLIGKGPLGIAVITVGAILLALLLTTPPVRWVTRWAVEPGSVLIRLRRKEKPKQLQP